MAEARLLIIDDDAAFRRLVTRVGVTAGYEVRETGDAAEFKKAALAWFPSLIITDLNMPEMDGIELLRELAVGKCTAPIVVASGIDGRTLDASLRLGVERGLRMDGVLQKPVSVVSLQKLLLRHKPMDDAALLGDLAQAIGDPKTQSTATAGPDLSELFLEYQPKVSSHSGRIIGVEALIRWAHPRIGIVRPDKFIPIAEETDLIDPLTNWVFATAVKQGVAWQRQGTPLDVAINVSARNFRDIRFPDRLHDKCRECGADPGLLTIEVTETGAMRDAVNMLDVLSRLRLKGFKLSLDDFGTGYSSLVQLRKMPFSELKIDVSFVAAMLRDKDSRFIVEVTIDLAKKLGVKSIAEGVENEAIWETLLDLGCDMGQGYYLGRPTSADRISSAAVAAQVIHKNNIPAILS